MRLIDARGRSVKRSRTNEENSSLNQHKIQIVVFLFSAIMEKHEKHIEKHDNHVNSLMEKHTSETETCPVFFTLLFNFTGMFFHEWSYVAIMFFHVFLMFSHYYTDCFKRKVSENTKHWGKMKTVGNAVLTAGIRHNFGIVHQQVLLVNTGFTLANKTLANKCGK